MHDIDTSLLRTFIILAETKSFTRTAEKVGRSQSAISMQITKLENLLNCELFERNNRNVMLSLNGEKLLGYARQIVAMSDSLLSRFKEQEVEGEIRFGSPEDFATSYLPDILATFVQSHPRVALNVNCDLTLSLLKGYENNEYDLIVIKQEPSQLHRGAQPLWREQLVWVGHSQAENSKALKDLMNFQGSALPLVLAPAPCVYRARAIEALDKAGIRWKIMYTSTSVAGTIAAVKAGLGFAVLPLNMVPDNLITLGQEGGWPKLKDAEICLLARSERSLAINALAEFIRKRLSFDQ